MKWLQRWFVLGLLLVCIGAAVADSRFVVLPVVAAVVVLGSLVLERGLGRGASRSDRAAADVPR